jgi:hypothetical protein
MSTKIENSTDVIKKTPKKGDNEIEEENLITTKEVEE